VRTDLRPEVPRPAPANKLSSEERKTVLSACHNPRYAGLPPGQIVPKLADQGVYIASESSFYLLLREADEQHHRGRSRKPQASTPPKGYCATGPNQVWSWDITYLPTLVSGIFFYLYMIIDVFSRKIVGWGRSTLRSLASMPAFWSIKRFCLKAAPRRRRYFTKTTGRHRKASP